MRPKYDSALALRTAIEDRIKTSAKEPQDIHRLRQRVAFERFLDRLFHESNVPWILKGGYALQLRLENKARATKDLDLTIPRLEWLQNVISVEEGMSKEEIVLEALRQHAEINLGDHFVFEIQDASPLLAGAPEGGIRCSVKCYLGKEFITFHLDVGFGDAITGSTEWFKGQSDLTFAEIPSPRIGLIPIEQHFAEKAHAYTLDWGERTNSRVKDLIDMVLIIENEQLNLESVRYALEIVFAHRHKHALPVDFPKPPAVWAESYNAEAQKLKLNASTLDNAHVLVANLWHELHLT